MTALLHLIGVDARQWRAVSRALLRADLRGPAAMHGERYTLRRVAGWVQLAAVYGVLGGAAALLVATNGDVLLTGTVAMSSVAFAVAAAVLSDHAAVLLGSAELAVLGSRPVSSRTLLAIRLTNVLFHAMFIAALTAWPVVLAYAATGEPAIARGIAAMAAASGCASAVALGLAAVYIALLERIGPARLQRAVGYAQIVLGLACYGGVFVLVRVALGMADAVLPRGAWLVAVPPAWYASYLEIADGRFAAGVWLRAALSLAVPAALAWMLCARMGDTYLQRLTELAGAEAPPRRRAGGISRAPVWGAGETRAVALLVWAHLRRDLRVRMGLLAVVPLIAIYLALDILEARPASASGGGDGTPMAVMAILIFPAVLVRQLGSSEHAAAAWIYAASGADPGRLVVALMRIAIVALLVPFVLLVTAILVWRSAHVGPALAQGVLAGLAGCIALQASMLIGPCLPFARAPDKVMGSAALLGWLVFVLIGGQILLELLARWLESDGTRVLWVASVLLCAAWALDAAVARRAARFYQPL